MIPTMFQSFAYDHSQNPVTKGKHRRCSYCFSRNNLQLQSVGVYICNRCKSVIEHQESTDQSLEKEIYKIVKREIPIFELRALGEFLRYLVFEPDHQLVNGIRRELRIRGNIDKYFLDYLRSRVEKIIEIKKGILNEAIDPKFVAKFLKITPTSLFHILAHLLNLHYFKEETKGVVQSLFSSFGINNPNKLRTIMLELARLSEAI
ncbi:MAG: hypothetical protein D6732_15535 [Methanobacteriota archaeon]|nr:MAG: hypothetical protein D6732_15535 [Euryarchaeota archaeon]